MSTNINKAQAEALKSGFDFGGSNDITEFSEVSSQLEKYGGLLIENVTRNLNSRKVNSSGILERSMVPEIEETSGGVIFRLKIIDYYDYPNEGVKGVKSSSNAPNSPYKYRNLGVPKSMQKSLETYIQSGKAKITSVRNDKALGIGAERKSIKLSQKKTLVEQQAATLGYLIKRFGIKATHYFTDAFNKTFANFDVAMIDAVNRDLVITFKQVKGR